MSYSEMIGALDLLRALGDPTRLRIVALLRVMELSVGELAQVLGQSQPRVSRHVRILGDAGVATRRREGSWVFVALADEACVEPLLVALDGWTAKRPDAATGDLARLAAVRAERAAAAERYFESHAAQWDAIRSLHVAESEVEAALAAIVGAEPIGRLVDVGTGTGRMLALFAGRAANAIGIDRSSEMLRLARAKLADAADGGGRAELRQADMYALPLPPASADLVLLHQVLHYAEDPAGAIAEAARLLAPSGRLLIVDFAPHEHEELRARDAHVRLGFADEAVLGWLGAAGLEAAPCAELGGGELTVKIWRGARPALAAVARRVA